MPWSGVASAGQAMKQVTARPTTLLLALVVLTAGASEGGPSINISTAVGNQTSVSRWCTADELMPRQLAKDVLISPEWSTEFVEPPYGCDCSFYKTRYFCPNLGDQAYRSWAPQAVTDGVCKSVTRSDLRQAPLPPDFKVLVYGNSHLRQVVEALMCLFSEKVETKRVKYNMENRGDYEIVPGETVCRTCWDVGRRSLREHGCMSRDEQREGCLCTDDYGEFNFENGATLHYAFANNQWNKSVSDSLPAHGDVTWSWYDVVFANQGNSPPMLPDALVTSAAELQEAAVPFFWLNTYEGEGEVSRWEESQRSRFEGSGAKHLKIDAMTRGMENLIKGAVESEYPDDPHFCLPGPPDEMAVLLAKILWAVYFEI